MTRDAFWLPDSAAPYVAVGTELTERRRPLPI